jgi:hypothetical protein
MPGATLMLTMRNSGLELMNPDTGFNDVMGFDVEILRRRRDNPTGRPPTPRVDEYCNNQRKQ